MCQNALVFLSLDFVHFFTVSNLTLPAFPRSLIENCFAFSSPSPLMMDDMLSTEINLRGVFETFLANE